MKSVKNTLLLSCLKATELMEKKLDFKLSFKEKIQLSIHKSMCEACRLYENQSRFIDEGISRINQPEHAYADLSKLKQKITETISKE